MFLTQYGGPRRVRVNPLGQSDLDGFVHVGHIPMYLCVEAKMGKDSLRKSQQMRKDAMNSLGVIYHVVRETHFEADMDELCAKIEEYGSTESLSSHTTEPRSK